MLRWPCITISLIALVYLANSNEPRYVLCSDSAVQPSAALAGRTLRVFAASVASIEGPASTRLGRQQAPLSLRAALLLDDPNHWTARLPGGQSGVHAKAGHDAQVSYAKCFGARLPNFTAVGCRLGAGHGARADFKWNASWATGRFYRFTNQELRHDFVSCALGGAVTRRWQRAPGPPERLHVQLAFATQGDPVYLPLELCRVKRPVLRLSFCSQPLYGYGKLRRELPWIMEDWLEYHLGHLGFEHAEIYDTDGSFADTVEPWAAGLKGTHGTVTYHKGFPESLSQSMNDISQVKPYCAETWAYAHCLTHHRALSRWVMLLHAPDEYVVTKSFQPGAVLPVLREIENSLPEDEAITMLTVPARSMAQGGPGAESTTFAAPKRGGVLAASRLHGPIQPLHTPLVDPASCVCAGAHACYAEKDYEFGGLTQQLDPVFMVVNHYVEMLARNRGRCTSMGDVCETPEVGRGDSWAEWAVGWLRAR